MIAAGARPSGPSAQDVARARKWIEDMIKRGWITKAVRELWSPGNDPLTANLAALVAEARAAQREVDARIAEERTFASSNMGVNWDYGQDGVDGAIEAARSIAAAIRAGDAGRALDRGASAPQADGR